jgi:hypothetical protein
MLQEQDRQKQDQKIPWVTDATLRKTQDRHFIPKTHARALRAHLQLQPGRLRGQHSLSMISTHVPAETSTAHAAMHRSAIRMQHSYPLQHEAVHGHSVQQQHHTAVCALQKGTTHDQATQ